MSSIRSRLAAGILIASAVCFSVGSHLVSAEPAAGAVQDADLAFAALRAIGQEQAPADLASDDNGRWHILHSMRMREAALKFYRDFPGDPRRWEAAVMYYPLNMHVFPGAGRYAATVRELIDAALSATDIEDRWWQAAKEIQIDDVLGQAQRLKSNYGVSVEPLPIRRLIEELETRFPDSPAVLSAQVGYVNLLKLHDPASAEAWMARLATSPNRMVAQTMTGQLRILRMKQEPAQIAFTAIDGRRVDLQSLRGKVVLLDFWATTCGPCIAEQPNIKAAYEKYHRQGFEVIGISLDGKAGGPQVEKFIAKHQLPWPQVLDEETEADSLSRRFGIVAIPTQLLLDRDGLLVSDAARGETLQKLLEGLF